MLLLLIGFYSGMSYMSTDTFTGPALLQDKYEEEDNYWAKFIDPVTQEIRIAKIEKTTWQLLEHNIEYTITIRQNDTFKTPQLINIEKTSK